ncbi:MAG: hypothetical protein M1153_01170 [Patescibacteria group bacterium]|nr:hypothetical protein [Patescibacteria group bacterium]
MIYIIGINHEKHQFGKSQNTTEVKKLRVALEKLIRDESISVVAEENSEEALKIHEINKTISQVVAEEHGISYVLADPDSKERKTLGIRSRQETALSIGIHFNESTVGTLTKDQQNKINIAHRNTDHKREKEWLQRIKKYINEPTVFICGFGHADTFFKLLTDNGYQVTVYCKYE